MQTILNTPALWKKLISYVIATDVSVAFAAKQSNGKRHAWKQFPGNEQWTVTTIIFERKI